MKTGFQAGRRRLGRRSLGPLAVGTAAILFLSGCLGGGKPDISGAYGTDPHVKITNVIRVTEINSWVISEGTGAVIDIEKKPVLGIQWGVWNGTTGRRLGNPVTFGNPKETTYLPVGGTSFWDTILKDKKVGSRIAAEIPGSTIWRTSPQFTDTSPKDNALVIMDIISEVPTAPSGTTIPLPAGFPAVTGEVSEPVIAAMGTAPVPPELKVATLVEGSGEQITLQDHLTVNYLGTLWGDGKVFDSSFARHTPQQFQLTGLIPGVQQALNGKRVGSRVLMIIPPALAYGDNAQGEIPPNSTLVMLFDLIAASSIGG